MKKYVFILLISCAILFFGCAEEKYIDSDTTHEEEYLDDAYYEDEYSDKGYYEEEIDYYSLLDSVDSTCFSSVGYDYDESVLVVEFLESGSVYLYYDISEDVYEELIYADSIGGYYNDYIKGQYTSEQIY